jgi:hypothetical protein
LSTIARILEEFSLPSGVSLLSLLVRDAEAPGRIEIPCALKHIAQGIEDQRCRSVFVIQGDPVARQAGFDSLQEAASPP